MSMRVFVTGGTGFVGSHVVEELLDSGHEPLCLIRETSDTEHLDELGVDTVVGSLTEIEELAGAVEGSDAIIHIAGVIKVKDFDWFYEINGEATGELGRLARKVNPGLERFVYVSSVAAQGPSDGDQPRPVERDPAPVSHYGRSKLLGETQLQQIADDIPVSIFRPPPVYGPRDYEMLAAFKMTRRGFAAVYGGGDSLTSVVHAHDLADAVVRSIDVDHESGSIFPIDDGEVHSWTSLMKGIGKAMGKDPITFCIPRPFFHAAAHVSEAWGNLTDSATIFNTDKVAEMSQPSWICGYRQLDEKLDWQPQLPLDKGARQTAEWYLEHGWI